MTEIIDSFQNANYEFAEKNIKELLNTYPDAPELHYYLGAVNLVKSKPNIAYDNFSRAIKLNPYYYEAYYRRGITNYTLEKNFEAKRWGETNESFYKYWQNYEQNRVNSKQY